MIELKWHDICIVAHRNIILDVFLRIKSNTFCDVFSLNNYMRIQLLLSIFGLLCKTHGKTRLNFHPSQFIK